MSKIKLTGDSSGYVEISAPSAAGNNTLELPSSGSKIVVADASDNVNVAGILTATSFSGPLTGNVTGDLTSSGVSTVGQLNVGTGGTIITTTGSIDFQVKTSGGLQVVNADEIALRYNAYYDGTDKYIQAANKASSLVMNSSGEFRFYNTNTASTSAGSSITGWTERVRIDSSGRVTMPYQPAFKAGRNSAYSPGAGSVIVFNSDSGDGRHNIGGHYSPSTGQFTAPVSGVYHFDVHVIWQALGSGQNMTDAYYWYLNGTSEVGYSGRRSYYVANTTGEGGYYTDWNSNQFYLSANDTMAIKNNRNLQVHGNVNYTWFAGYLVG